MAAGLSDKSFMASSRTSVREIMERCCRRVNGEDFSDRKVGFLVISVDQFGVLPVVLVVLLLSVLLVLPFDWSTGG